MESDQEIPNDCNTEKQEILFDTSNSSPIIKQTTEIFMEEVDIYEEDEKIRQNQQGSPEYHEGRKVALAFPGGGIRTAAFCYGVLRHLTRNDYKIQAISNVSGGGYTGGSFVQSLYDSMKRKGKDYKTAVEDFFNHAHMEKYAGFMVDCHGNIFRGIIEGIALSLVFITWFLMIFLGQVPLWFIIAAIFDPIFGYQLREPGWNALSPSLIGLGASMGALWLLWYVTSCLPANTTVRRFQNLIQIIFLGFFFVLSCLLLIKLTRVIRNHQTQTDETVLFLLLIVFIFRPLFKKASPAKRFTSLLVYAAVVSRIAYWHIYTDDYILFWWGKYSSDQWNIIVLVSGIMLLLPFQLIQTTFFHYYYRWRIQKSFLQHSGCFGCADLPCVGGKQYTLGEINLPEIPTFIGATVINGWKKDPSCKDSYHLTTLETGGNLKIVGSDVTMKVGHIKMSEAMSLSAAAFAYRMGQWQDNVRFRFWQVQFGVSIGNWVYTKETKPVERWTPFFLGQAPFTLVAFLIYFLHLNPLWFLVPLCGVLISMILAVTFPPEWIYWVYHLPFILPIFEVFDIVVYGGKPLPLKVYLSDGAHAENLALLPLLDKRKFKKIVICDATEDPTEECCSLYDTVKLARQKLKCIFVPMERGDEMDVESEIARFVESKNRPFLRFRAIYHPEQPGEDMTLHSTEIIFLKIRKQFVQNNEEEFGENLNGCCCAVCHHPCCSCMNPLVGQFPHHRNINEFFTPKLFREYSTLGEKVAATCL